MDLLSQILKRRVEFKITLFLNISSKLELGENLQTLNLKEGENITVS